MQVLLSLPNVDEVEAERWVEQSLFRKVCGIPLLARVIATAHRSGGTEVLLLHPKSLSQSRLKVRLNSALISSVPVHTLPLDRAFDPEKASDWQRIESRLASKSLWLPWNYVVDKEALSRMIEAGKAANEGARFAWPETLSCPCWQEEGFSQSTGSDTPVVVMRDKLKQVAQSCADGASRKDGTLSRYRVGASLGTVSVPGSPGVLVYSRQTARQAERELVRRSGKESDGIYSKFNRWLSRPWVRWFSKTPVTPNVVSFGGLGAAFLSAYWFSQGYWSAYVLGALLYFVCVLFDEVDGMLARVTFRESAFGCWLETFVDYASYIVVFAGMTIGLYRESGPQWLVVGGLLIFGALASFVVVSNQRKLATDPDRPQEYRNRLHRRLEADSGNVLSRFGRLAETLVRKPAYTHYVLIFSILGAVKILLLLTALGSNLVWTLGLYFNRLFRSPSSGVQAGESCQKLGCSAKTAKWAPCPHPQDQQRATRLGAT